MARPRQYEDKNEEVKYLHSLGKTIREIAFEVGMSKSTVHRILNR
jgi:IS30 family transposase